MWVRSWIHLKFHMPCRTSHFNSTKTTQRFCVNILAALEEHSCCIRVTLLQNAFYYQKMVCSVQADPSSTVQRQEFPGICNLCARTPLHQLLYKFRVASHRSPMQSRAALRILLVQNTVHVSEGNMPQ